MTKPVRTLALFEVPIGGQKEPRQGQGLQSLLQHDQVDRCQLPARRGQVTAELKKAHRALACRVSRALMLSAETLELELRPNFQGLRVNSRVCAAFPAASKS